jgi:hypothetical protein
MATLMIATLTVAACASVDGSQGYRKLFVKKDMLMFFKERETSCDVSSTSVVCCIFFHFRLLFED